VLRTVLVANRGEIARRIIRGCRARGLASVAVYSEADRDAPHVTDADRAVAIGPAPARESYLDIGRLIGAARESGADAVHPGYGFLSENWRFAAACAEAGLTFIGPSPEAIRAMGDKTEARRRMAAAGVPIVPGSPEPVANAAAAERFAANVGYPVILKAAAGGGGIGMAKAATASELAPAWATATRRAQAAFGRADVYVERYVEQGRHIEVQVFGDAKGTVVHMHERECSIQRRHQKLVEESPAPHLAPAIKRGLTEAAVAGARAIGYVNAGTLEFLVDAQGDFFFIEINCRIQVEHPVTEALTGIDLVATQIRIAAGEPLGFGQSDVVTRGHAIEFRINAEDPEREFRPSAGVVDRYLPPGGPGVRMDSHLYSGYEIPPYYDSLLGKLIVWGPTREAAIARSRVALDDLLLEGVVTNVAIHKALLASDTFLDGKMTTNLLDRVGGAAILAAAART
jgi:acetyl-CoA carboxylase biotin carboxylase subunit